ncbi:hypothetical protein Lesp02_77600 [Lentzea sp. NBRC 105346]|uniref:GNAT family N-acetyltransferase n=1 Tax=Lentzea sp. NBRC 105346 TaxID=3032205 RepID=UPI0024A1938C|nr:GNAT family N-acetyltransferase [Lentzea sp. NBRC 105346]GLZ35573.1 hypothetical protein Lesp02_77600 [Lentzea sp. NBRC 105346]
MGDIELRAWTESEAPFYAEWTKDADVQRFTTDGPDITAETVARAIRAQRANPAVVSFLVADSHTGERHGNVALEIHDGVGEVSYLMAREARGKGIATAALTTFVGWIFANIALDELRLWTHADNVASRKVAERAGFVRDPDNDRDREIKGEIWPTAAYRQPRPN